MAGDGARKYVVVCVCVWGEVGHKLQEAFKNFEGLSLLLAPSLHTHLHRRQTKTRQTHPKAKVLR